MVTQKLNEALNLFGKNSLNSTGNSSGDVFRGVDFGNYLNHTLNSDTKEDTVNTNKPNQFVKTEEEKIQYKPSYKKETQVQTMDKQPVKSKKPEESNKDTVSRKDTKEKDIKSLDSKTVQKSESKEVSEEVVTKVKELSEKMESVVKDALGITQEELEGLMEFLGMQMTDLLNPNNLKLLALAANGETDFSAFLTNENLCADLNSLVQEIEQINLEDFNLTNEDLANFMEANQNTETTDFSLVDEVVSSNPEEKSDSVNDSLVNKTVTEGVVLANAKETDTKDMSADSANTQDTKESTIELQVEKISEHTEAGVGNENKGNSSQAQISQNTGLEQVIGNISLNSNTNANNFMEQISAARQMRAIVNQIVDEIKVSIKPDATSMELQLNPASLGKVNLAVVAKDGVLTAQFTVQNAAAKEAIESQLQNLKDNLSNQGIKVEAVEVTVSNFSFDGSNQADGNAKEHKQSHKKLTLEEIDGLDDFQVEEETDSNRMQLNGSTVEYTA